MYFHTACLIYKVLHSFKVSIIMLIDAYQLNNIFFPFSISFIQHLLFYYYFFLFLLFICAYNVWVIATPFPLPTPFSPPPPYPPLPPRYQAETILPLSLILLKRECKQ
jgi:hypothetical protein